MYVQVNAHMYDTRTWWVPVCIYVHTHMYVPCCSFISTWTSCGNTKINPIGFGHCMLVSCRLICHPTFNDGLLSFCCCFHQPFTCQVAGVPSTFTILVGRLEMCTDISPIRHHFMFSAFSNDRSTPPVIAHNTQITHRIPLFNCHPVQIVARQDSLVLLQQQL